MALCAHHGMKHKAAGKINWATVEVVARRRPRDQRRPAAEAAPAEAAAVPPPALPPLPLLGQKQPPSGAAVALAAAPEPCVPEPPPLPQQFAGSFPSAMPGNVAVPSFTPIRRPAGNVDANNPPDLPPAAQHQQRPPSPAPGVDGPPLRPDVHTYHLGRCGHEPRDTRTGELLRDLPPDDTSHGWNPPSDLVCRVRLRIPLVDGRETGGRTGGDDDVENSGANPRRQPQLPTHLEQTVEWDLSNPNNVSADEYAFRIGSEYGLDYAGTLELQASIEAQLERFVAGLRPEYYAPMPVRDAEGKRHGRARLAGPPESFSGRVTSSTSTRRGRGRTGGNNSKSGSSSSSGRSKGGGSGSAAPKKPTGVMPSTSKPKGRRTKAAARPRPLALPPSYDVSGVRRGRYEKVLVPPADSSAGGAGKRGGRSSAGSAVDGARAYRPSSRGTSRGTKNSRSSDLTSGMIDREPKRKKRRGADGSKPAASSAAAARPVQQTSSGPVPKLLPALFPTETCGGQDLDPTFPEDVNRVFTPEGSYEIAPEERAALLDRNAYQREIVAREHTHFSAGCAACGSAVPDDDAGAVRCPTCPRSYHPGCLVASRRPPSDAGRSQSCARCDRDSAVGPEEDITRTADDDVDGRIAKAFGGYAGEADHGTVCRMLSDALAIVERLIVYNFGYIFSVEGGCPFVAVERFLCAVFEILSSEYLLHSYSRHIPPQWTRSAYRTT